MFKNGMFGGSFDPLHLGHVKCILTAASECENLSIILSYSKLRDSVDVKIRYSWLHQITKNLSNIKIYLIEDTQTTKKDYDWNKGKEDIINTVGHDFDVVYCGMDYKYSNIFEGLYPLSEIKYFDFDRNNISSTNIRENPFSYWNDLPNIVKPYYTKKVLVLGGESTGKSTLTEKLANYYNTNYVEEVGRDVCEKFGAEEYMTEECFLQIMLEQKLNEIKAVNNSEKYLFIDTDVLTTMFYFDFLFMSSKNNSKYSNLASAIHSLSEYDLILFLEPEGTIFVQDGTRNEIIKADREKHSKLIKDVLNLYNVKYTCLSGDYSQRFVKAINLINTL